MDAALLRDINQRRHTRQAFALVGDLSGGEKQLISRKEASRQPLSSQLEARFLSGKSGMEEMDGKEFFIEMHLPATRIVVVGAVHISQALYPMCQACGFDVTIIDPRTAFATPERFTGVNLIADWPEDVLKDAPLDAYTAMVALTHDPKIDDGALEAALEAGCFYIGALGSRKTHAKRVARLEERGASSASLSNIHAPIGLNIGAATPAEIATAILAEIIATLRTPKAQTGSDAAK